MWRCKRKVIENKSFFFGSSETLMKEMTDYNSFYCITDSDIMRSDDEEESGD